VIPFEPSLDLYPMLAGVLAAVGCALLGNFLVLRRMSLMGDAISHSVLPGLVIAFIVTSSRSPLAMMLGAGVSGVATVLLVELVKRLGRVETGAAMGVVFSVLFALGVLLIEAGPLRHVDLDADCVLHGQLELLMLHPGPDSLGTVFSWGTVSDAPTQVKTLAGMVIVALLFVTAFFKELRIAAFDPALATSQGYSATLLHFMLMTLVAAATVASFEAVGSILVIAMLICPAATARLMTDRLRPQIAWSVLFAVVASVGGYLGASGVPAAFGKDAVNAAGSMTVVSGALLGLVIVFSPRHGLVSRAVRRARLARSVAVENLLAGVYRAAESGRAPVPLGEFAGSGHVAVRLATRRGLVVSSAGGVSLTEDGRRAGASLVRRHRLWERYLVEEAGISEDHVHDPAEVLEHLGLGPESDAPTDPHGRPIPPKEG